jgi:hypothetical protein
MSLTLFTIGLFFLTMSAYDSGGKTANTVAYIHDIDKTYNVICPAKVSFIASNKNISTLMHIPCSASSAPGSNKLLITYLVADPQKSMPLNQIIKQPYSYKYKIGIGLVTYGIVVCIFTYLVSEIKILFRISRHDAL